MSPEALATLRRAAEEQLRDAREARDDAATELERAEELRAQSAAILDRARTGLRAAQEHVYALITALDALDVAQGPTEAPQEATAPVQGLPEPGERLDAGGIYVEVEQ